MSYKQKHLEALDRARKIYDVADDELKAALAKIHPELVMGEEEIMLHDIERAVKDAYGEEYAHQLMCFIQPIDLGMDKPAVVLDIDPAGAARPARALVWRPSPEQLDALKSAANSYSDGNWLSPVNTRLWSLYNDLTEILKWAKMKVKIQI